MLHTFNGNLVTSRETTFVNENGSHEDAFICCDGINTMVVSARNKGLVEDTRTLVNYTHSIPIQVSNPGDQADAMVDAYMQQAAMITRNGCVPIPTFDDLHSREDIDFELTLQDSLGYWNAAIVDSQYNVETDILTIQVAMIGVVFKDQLDPEGKVDSNAVEDFILAKINFHDHSNTTLEYPEDSPYYIFSVGLSNVDLCKKSIIDDEVDESVGSA